jgi:hypothetical protein
MLSKYYCFSSCEFCYSLPPNCQYCSVHVAIQKHAEHSSSYVHLYSIRLLALANESQAHSTVSRSLSFMNARIAKFFVNLLRLPAVNHLFPLSSECRSPKSGCGRLGPWSRGCEAPPRMAVCRTGGACREEVAPPAKGVQGVTPENFLNFTCKAMKSGTLLDNVGLHVIMSKKDMKTVYRFCMQM